MSVVCLLEARVEKFIDLAEFLYRNSWVHFKLAGFGWTEGLEGEEKIFGVVLRTLLCNDESSKEFYEAIGGFKRVKERHYQEGDLEEWLTDKLEPFKMGTGKGSHRDGRHKGWTPQGIKEYFELTGFNQKKYFDNVGGYNELFNDVWSLMGNGPLTAFDIAKGLYEAGIIDLLPDRFYLTGGGEIEGMRALFPNLSDEELVEKGNELVNVIIDRTRMPKEVVYFGVEDLLCIYQKDSRYKEFLREGLSVREYGSILLGKNCLRERGVC